MKNYTEIVCLIDKSGSMGMIRKDTIGGFNTFLESQKLEPSEAKLTLTLFNTEIQNIYESSPLNEVFQLNEYNYIPSGGTSMYDAICLTIDSLGRRLSELNEDERPEKILFVILTDGEETSSLRFNKNDVNNKIKLQSEVYSWQFVFLGANLDASETAKSIGISANNAMQFASTPDSASLAFTNTSNYLKRTRGMTAAQYSVSLNSAFTDTEKDAVL